MWLALSLSAAQHPLNDANSTRDCLALLLLGTDRQRQRSAVMMTRSVVTLLDALGCAHASGTLWLAVVWLDLVGLVLTKERKWFDLFISNESFVMVCGVWDTDAWSSAADTEVTL